MNRYPCCEYFLVFYFHISVIKCSKEYCAKPKHRGIADCVVLSHCETACEPHEALAGRRKEELSIRFQNVVNQWENVSHNLSGILVYLQLRLPLTGSQSMSQFWFFSEFVH